MEQNYRIPGAFVDHVGDTSWFDYAEAQHAIWASITDCPQNDWCDAKVESDSQWQSTPESFAQSSQSSPEQDVVIAVMGVTGAGKSTFIKTVSGRNDVVVGDNLSSGSSKSSPQCWAIGLPTDLHNPETQEVHAYEFVHKSTNYILVDTPGFDDTNRKDSEIIEQILGWIKTSLLEGTRLNGVIYLHRISDPRMGGTALRNNRMFRKLVGADALKNVILATTFWEGIPPHVGAQREKELCSNPDFWGGMLDQGAKMVKLTKSRESGLALLEQILADETVVLDDESVLREQRETLEKMEKKMEEEKEAARLKMEREVEQARREAAKKLAREKRELRKQREKEEEERKAAEITLEMERIEARIRYERELEEARKKAVREQERRQREKIEMERREREARERQKQMEEEAAAAVVTQRLEYQRNYVCTYVRPQWPCDKCKGRVQRYTTYYRKSFLI
ncbi:hypothetical protein G7Y89_g13005 [Cudoniella acicularis]|uniref:G domain-containing protein n=1 Tax=Cudoniella acicularis TaxID=354080 RepID=A0A8H4RAG0_9HELO|nr:hypothetical protein G7Y89_g13005 [Cudoniella acicularis]